MQRRRRRIPTLVVLAATDRVVDNARTRKRFEAMRVPGKRRVRVPAEQGIQSDAAERAAPVVGDWITPSANRWGCATPLLSGGATRVKPWG